LRLRKGVDETNTKPGKRNNNNYEDCKSDQVRFEFLGKKEGQGVLEAKDETRRSMSSPRHIVLGVIDGKRQKEGGKETGNREKKKKAKRIV